MESTLRREPSGHYLISYASVSVTTSWEGINSLPSTEAWVGVMAVDDEAFSSWVRERKEAFETCFVGDEQEGNRRIEATVGPGGELSFRETESAVVVSEAQRICVAEVLANRPAPAGSRIVDVRLSVQLERATNFE